MAGLWRPNGEVRDTRHALTWLTYAGRVTERRWSRMIGTQSKVGVRGHAACPDDDPHIRSIVTPYAGDGAGNKENIRRVG